MEKLSTISIFGVILIVAIFVFFNEEKRMVFAGGGVDRETYSCPKIMETLERSSGVSEIELGSLYKELEINKCSDALARLKMAHNPQGLSRCPSINGALLVFDGFVIYEEFVSYIEDLLDNKCWDVLIVIDEYIKEAGGGGVKSAYNCPAANLVWEEMLANPEGESIRDIFKELRVMECNQTIRELKNLIFMKSLKNKEEKKGDDYFDILPITPITPVVFNS